MDHLGCREGKPPWPLSKKPLFFLKSGCFSPKIDKKKKKCQNPFQAIIRQKRKKKKWHGPISHWCREGKTLVVRPLKKTFLCVFFISDPFHYPIIKVPQTIVKIKLDIKPEDWKKCFICLTINLSFFVVFHTFLHIRIIIRYMC